MGVHNFSKVFGSAGQPVAKLDSLVKGKIVGCDINPIIYASIKAMYQGTHLTDPNGVPTASLNTLLSNILMLKKAGATVVGILDNPKRNIHKHIEHKKRHDAKIKSEKKMEETEGEEKKKHESNAWRLTDMVVKDAQTLMTLMGVDYYISPLNREAEQYAADMVKEGKIDIVMTNDSDAVLFGAPTVILSKTKKSEKSKSPYTLFRIEKLLDEYKLDMDTFQKMCIAIGTDFAPKTKGVGVKTVFTSGKNKPLTEDQLKAAEYIKSGPTELGTIVKGAFNKAELIKWLVDDKGFNEDRIIKKLKLQ
jgi:5'-3' exonuclease